MKMIYTLAYNGNYGYNLIEEKSQMGITGGRFVPLSVYEKAVKKIEELENQLNIANSDILDLQRKW